MEELRPGGSGEAALVSQLSFGEAALCCHGVPAQAGEVQSSTETENALQQNRETGINS